MDDSAIRDYWDSHVKQQIFNLLNGVPKEEIIVNILEEVYLDTVSLEKNVEVISKLIDEIMEQIESIVCIDAIEKTLTEAYGDLNMTAKMLAKKLKDRLDKLGAPEEIESINKYCLKKVVMYWTQNQQAHRSDDNMHQNIRTFIENVLNIIIKNKDYTLQKLTLAIAIEKCSDNKTIDAESVEGLIINAIRDYKRGPSDPYLNIERRIREILKYDYKMLVNTFKYDVSFSEEQWNGFRAQYENLNPTSKDTETELNIIK